MNEIMTLAMLRGCSMSSVRFAKAHSVTQCACRVNAMTVSTSATLGKKKVLRRKDKIDLVETITKGQLKKKMTKMIEVHKDMRPIDLARSLEADLDDVLMTLLDLNGTRHIRSEFTRIGSVSILNEFAKKTGIKVKVVKAPEKGNLLSNIFEAEEKNLDFVPQPPPRPEDLKPRPPVVAIMGHIDHGKTTLLDCLRKSRIVEGEFGGITQHIGAFSVKLKSSKEVTFIDTPGHAAFKAMRSRGAKTTDIVVLVVDSSEGVLEQTLESIRMIREAKTPMMVALNKIDRPGADVDGTKLALREAGVELEEFGGDVQTIPISALKGTNVDGLVEGLQALSEVLELKADSGSKVEGVVIESTTEKGLGKTATVLVQRGTLRTGSFLISGKSACKVRTMHDDTGAPVKEATPSKAVKVSGWKQVPAAGDAVYQVESDGRAQEIVNWREKEEKKSSAAKDAEAIDKQRAVDRAAYEEYRLKKLQAGIRWRAPLGYNADIDAYQRRKETAEYTGPPKVPMIVRTDVDGSLEAILNCFETYDDGTREDLSVRLDILDFGVGAVTESDVQLAANFGGFIYAFNTDVADAVRKSAREAGVALKEFNIIYKLIDDLRGEIGERMPVEDVTETSGRAVVQKEFLINTKGQKTPVAGCRVESGRILQTQRVRVMRGHRDVVYDGTLAELKRHKDVVPEVSHGMECGIMVQDAAVRFNPGDAIESYTVRQEKRKLEWNPGF